MPSPDEAELPEPELPEPESSELRASPEALPPLDAMAFTSSVGRLAKLPGLFSAELMMVVVWSRSDLSLEVV